MVIAPDRLLLVQVPQSRTNLQQNSVPGGSGRLRATLHRPYCISRAAPGHHLLRENQLRQANSHAHAVEGNDDGVPEPTQHTEFAGQ